MSASESLFEGIEDAPVSETRVYIKPGIYKSEIVEVKGWKSRQTGETCFAVSLRILESNNSDQPVGMRVNWMQKSSWKGWMGRVKGFILAAYRSKDPNEPMSESDINAEGVDMMIAKKDLDGVHVGYNCVKIEREGKSSIDATTFFPPKA